MPHAWTAAVIAVLLGAAAAPAAAPPVRPEIWRGARAGMTMEEVQALFPNGRAPGGAPGEAGLTPGWSMDEQVYGRDGVATFYFRSGRLASVLVDLNKVKANSARSNLAAARELSTSLSGYYGKPKDCVDASRGGLDRLDCRWAANGLQIGLSYLDYGGRSPVLDLSIRLEPPKPANPGAVFKPRGHRL